MSRAMREKKLRTLGLPVLQSHLAPAAMRA